MLKGPAGQPAIPPYARNAVVHSNAEFATLNKFLEDTFDLGTLGSPGATDDSPYVGNLDGFFDFNSPPKTFTKLKVPDYYLNCSNYGDEVHIPPGMSKPRWLQIVGGGDD